MEDCFRDFDLEHLEFLKWGLIVRLVLVVVLGVLEIAFGAVIRVTDLGCLKEH